MFVRFPRLTGLSPFCVSNLLTFSRNLLTVKGQTQREKILKNTWSKGGILI